MSKDEDERLRVLNEMRAYGKAAPFAHVANAEPGPRRENIYDASTKEWLASKTFKTILWLACIIPVILMCLFFVLTIGGVGWAGTVILGDIQRLMGGY